MTTTIQIGTFTPTEAPNVRCAIVTNSAGEHIGKLFAIRTRGLVTEYKATIYKHTAQTFTVADHGTPHKAKAAAKAWLANPADTEMDDTNAEDLLRSVQDAAPPGIAADHTDTADRFALTCPQTGRYFGDVSYKGSNRWCHHSTAGTRIEDSLEGIMQAVAAIENLKIGVDTATRPSTTVVTEVKKLEKLTCGCCLGSFRHQGGVIVRHGWNAHNVQHGTTGGYQTGHCPPCATEASTDIKQALEDIAKEVTASVVLHLDDYPKLTGIAMVQALFQIDRNLFVLPGDLSVTLPLPSLVLAALEDIKGDGVEELKSAIRKKLSVRVDSAD